MITESITIQMLHVISLALTPSQRWAAARHPFNASSAAEGWLTIFAMVSLIISVILVFWLIATNRRSENCLKKELEGLNKIKREIEGLGLTVAIEDLRQEIAVLGQQIPAVTSEQAPSDESGEPVVVRES